MGFFRRNRDGGGDNKEPEEEKKAQPSRPFSSTREGGSGSARPAGKSDEDDKKSSSPFNRSSLFSRRTDDSEKPSGESSGRTLPPGERPARPAGISPTSGRTPLSGGLRRNPESTDSEEKKEANPPSRFGSFRRDTEEKKESDSGSSFRTGTGSFRRPGSDAEEKKDESPPSRFGTFRRPGSDAEEKKETNPPSRFGNFRRDTEEKKEGDSGTSFRTGTGSFRRPGSDAEEKKDDTPPSRFGSFRRDTEEKKESGSGTSFRTGTGSFRRPGSDAEEKKDDNPPSRFGSFRRDTEEKKEGESGTSFRTGTGSFRRPGSDVEEKKDDNPPSRFGSFRRDTEEKKESDSGTSFRTGTGSFRRPGSDAEEKKDDNPPSRFGSFRRSTEAGEKKDESPGTRPTSIRRPESRVEEKKDSTESTGSRFSLRRPGATGEKKEEETTGGRFLGLRRPGGDTEEKKETSESTGSRFSLRRPGATGEKKESDAPSGGIASRFGLRRSPTEAKPEEKKETESASGSRFGLRRPATTEEKPAAPTRPTAQPPKPASTRVADKPVPPPARPKSNRAEAKPLPSTKARLPRLVKAGPSLDFQLDMVGGVLVVIGLILISGFISPGAATGVVDSYLAQLFGVGRILVPFALGGVGIWLLISRFGNVMFDIEYFRILGVVLLFIVVLATLQWGFLFSEVVPSYDVLAQNSERLWRDGEAGGIIGHIVYIFFARQLGDYAVVVFLASWWAVGLMLAFNTTPSQIVEQGRNVRHSLQVRNEAARARREAKRADIAALAAATAEVATAPQQRAPQTATTGRTTTPEQDQAKAAETLTTPVRQVEEKQTSRFGRFLRGDKVTAEKVEAPAEGGRTVAPDEAAPQPAEGAAVIIEKPAEASESTVSRMGRFNLLRRKSVEETPAQEKSSEQVAGRRLSVDTAAPTTGEATTEADEEKSESQGRLGGRLGVGRLMNRAATPSEESTEKPVEATPAENRGGRFSLFQRSKPSDEEKSAESSTDVKPVESPAQKSEAPAERELTSRWIGRKEETTQSESNAVPQRRITVGRLATLSEENTSAVSQEDKLGDTQPTTPLPVEETKTSEPQPDAVAEVSNRFNELRARRLAAIERPDTPPASEGDSQKEPDAQETPAVELSNLQARNTAEFLPPISKEEAEAVSENEQPPVEQPAETSPDALAGPTETLQDTPEQSLFARRESPFRRDMERPASPMGLQRPPAAPAETEVETPPVAEEVAPPAEEIKPAQPRGLFVRRFQQEETQQPPNIEATPITTEQFDEKIEEIFNQPGEVESAPEPVTPSPPIAETVAEKSDWKLPEFMKLLEPGSEQEINQHYLLEQARIIEDTLSSFGAPGKVVEVNSGPVITQFGVEPDYIERRGGRTRVKVSQIAALEKDIALALAAKTIRIEAPVPGKGFVGIEVPNVEAAVVSLRDVMSSEEHQKMQQRSSLAIGLGQAVDGAPISTDLTALPHLLIAGTTGSGKSVCVNAIISCLLLQNTPTELQMIMVDPKRVELTGYNGIPHLISSVVVDLERIVGVLKWVQREMDERYRKLNERGARNIQDYNRRATEKMPYLVVIIDELADLMMLAPDETEKLIARLAQMARATGIHLIISTQRPSVDVVTGLIKANFPARIAFAVASGTDSRVILDAPGADRLLGRGDMLFQAPDASAPVRMQGVYVSDPEIERITRYWKEQAIVVRRGAPSASILKLGEEPQRTAPMPVSRSERYGADIRPVQNFWKEIDELANSRDDDDIPEGDEDEMYDEAVRIVRQLEKASISLLQRRLRIGYTRAARLIDMMEARGIIGPATDSGSKPRDVFPSSNDDI